MKKKRKKFDEWGPGMSHEAAGKFMKRFLAWAGLGWRRVPAGEGGWRKYPHGSICVTFGRPDDGYVIPFSSWKQMMFGGGESLIERWNYSVCPRPSSYKIDMLRSAVETGSPAAVELALAASGFTSASTEAAT